MKLLLMLFKVVFICIFLAAALVFAPYDAKATCLGAFNCYNILVPGGPCEYINRPSCSGSNQSACISSPNCDCVGGVTCHWDDNAGPPLPTPTPEPGCTCTTSFGVCGTGGCPSTQRPKYINCTNPCEDETICENDPSCGFSCNVSASSLVQVGSNVNYTVNKTTSATSMSLSYKAFDSTPNWASLVSNSNANSESGAFTCPSAEEFALACSATSATNSCTGNPWCPGLPTMADEFGSPCASPDCIVGDCEELIV